MATIWLMCIIICFCLTGKPPTETQAIVLALFYIGDRIGSKRKE